MALKCRNSLFPLSPEAIAEIKEDIESKKQKRIREKLEASKKEASKLINNEKLKKEAENRLLKSKLSVALKD